MIALLLVLAQAAPRPGTVATQPPIAAQANAARESGKLDQAVALYRQGVAASPRWAEGWWFLGTILYERDQYAACRDAFRRYVALDPKSGPAHALLGLCEYQVKNFAAATKALETATALGLPNGEQLTRVAQYHLALGQLKAGNYERALQVASFAAKDKDTPELIAVCGFAALRRSATPAELDSADRELVFKMGRAMVFLADRRAPEARELLEELARAYPSAPNVHYNLGAMLLNAEADLGLAALKRELDLDPNHLPALVSIAAEYLKRGEPAAARPFAERAAKAGIYNFPARATLGRVLVELNDIPGAIRELEVAVKLAPDSPQVQFSLASAYARAGRKEDAARARAEFARLKQLTGQ